jgi:hypothetical protein
MFYALGVRHFVLGVPNFHVPRCPFHIVSLPVLVVFVDCNDHHDGDNDTESEDGGNIQEGSRRREGDSRFKLVNAGKMSTRIL